jgi:hypothetical protein
MFTRGTEAARRSNARPIVTEIEPAADFHRAED